MSEDNQWSKVFLLTIVSLVMMRASVAERNEAGRFLFAGPDWDGEEPAGITGVLWSETDFIFNVTRTERFFQYLDFMMGLLKEPGPGEEAHWLPAPDGPFYTVMRLYGPRTAALDGHWTPPPVVKVERKPNNGEKKE